MIETTAIENMVISIRQELANNYDISDQEDNEYRNYRGLCDEAYLILKRKIERMNVGLMVDHIHGEQKHTPAIDSNNWCYQHTWARVHDVFNRYIVYVDITSQQFQFLYDDIPNYYISMSPPKWYYSDRWNLQIRLYNYIPSLSRWLSKAEYYTWGKISDLIHRYVLCLR